MGGLGQRGAHRAIVAAPTSVRPEPVEGQRAEKGFDRLSPNGSNAGPG
jgi:hypothetical protein